MRIDHSDDLLLSIKSHSHVQHRFIIGLFYGVDLTLGHLPKHPQAKLYASEIVTLALLFALKGGSVRVFYR